MEPAELTECSVQDDLQEQDCDAHDGADADVKGELAGGGVRADAGEKLECDEAGDGAPQRGVDAGGERCAGGPGEQQREQRQGGAADDRPVAGECLQERLGGEALLRGEAVPEDVGVGVGEPVERGCDDGRCDGVNVGLVTSALSGEQGADDDDPVDDPCGVLSACDLLDGARKPRARRRRARRPWRRRGLLGRRRLRDRGIIRWSSADQHGRAVARDVRAVFDLHQRLVETALHADDAAEG